MAAMSHRVFIFSTTVPIDALEGLGVCSIAASFGEKARVAVLVGRDLSHTAIVPAASLALFVVRRKVGQCWRKLLNLNQLAARQKY
jgi:hypothetical protein